MRYGLLVLGIAACIGLYQAWFARACDQATTAALSADAQLAINVRCNGRADRAKRECRTMMTKLFLSGSLDPDRTLRAYCDSVKNAQWGGGHPAPPKLCVERYGGWQQS